jgi:hypothetical protein
MSWILLTYGFQLTKQQMHLGDMWRIVWLGNFQKMNLENLIFWRLNNLERTNHETIARFVNQSLGKGFSLF